MEKQNHSSKTDARQHSDLLSKEFLSGNDNSYAILQLKRPGHGLSQEEWHERAFEPLSRLQAHGLKPEPETYETLYTGNLPSASFSFNQPALLENLYRIFNTDEMPADFRGHSLSVGDIVALKQNGKVSCHYVDSIGFRELPNFEIANCREGEGKPPINAQLKAAEEKRNLFKKETEQPAPGRYEKDQ